MKPSYEIQVTSKASVKINSKLIYKLAYLEEQLLLTSLDDKSSQGNIFVETVKNDLNIKYFLSNLPQHFVTVNQIGNIYELSVFNVSYIQNIDKFIFDLSGPNCPSKEIVNYDTIHHDLNNNEILILAKNTSNKDFIIISKAKKLNKQTSYSFETLTKNEKFYYVIKKQLTYDETKNYLKDSKIFMLSGLFEFNESQHNSANDQKTKEVLEFTDINTNRYIEFWDKYNSEEAESKFSTIKEIQYLKFNAIELNTSETSVQKNSIRINMIIDETSTDKISKLQEESICFFSDDKLLAKVQNTKSSIFDSTKEYLDFEKQLNTPPDAINLHKAIVVKLNQNTRIIQLDLIDVNANSFDLKSLPTQGIIMVSTIGNYIAYNRREKAKDRFQQNKVGMKALYSIFSDDPIPQIPIQKIYIDHTLFSKPMTLNQIEAINIICNTPDFAIIQGPPGTGKTTVISAAVNQINSKSHLQLSGKNTVLTANRNETVENLIEKVSVYGLPTMKVENAKNISFVKNNEVVNDYFEELSAKLNQKYSNLKYVDEIINSFIKKKNHFIYFSNSLEDTDEMIQYLMNLPGTSLEVSIVEALSTLSKKIHIQSVKSDYQTIQFLSLLYKTPTSNLKFEDGGEDWLLDLKSLLLNPSPINANIIKLISLFETIPIDYQHVHIAKRKLIVLYKPISTTFVTMAIKQELILIIDRIQKILEVNVFDKSQYKNKVIYNFIQSFNENSESLKKTIRNYTKTIGVTNQLVFSRGFFSSVNNEFVENIIVDEAATSSPLDLFIPMSVATRRIVLVGDHKQLPNIVDEKIAKLVEQQYIEDDKRAYQEEINQTLFQHLYKKCQLLEKKDGIRRVITLNAQFRMHPLLGKIVSDFFYDGFLESPRPASDFNHNFLGLTNTPLVWFDVPYNKNDSYRQSNSRINKAEAKLIALKIKQAITSKTYAKESIGVITFYRPQVQILREALNNEGINYDESSTFASFEGINFQLEINTVDAFQGKEFDVVFLSVAYTFPPDKLSNENFSRLVVKNLLCVALSRQKKMLIVVGSKSIFNGEIAFKKVPSMFEVLKICKEKGYLYE